MSASTKRLGRGLDSLILSSTSVRPDAGRPPHSNIEGNEDQPSVSRVPIAQVKPNRHQPRLAADEAGIAQLAQSLRQTGILQPILVRPAGNEYEIIAGERRYRAARLLGWTDIPVLVRRASDEEMLEMALIENIHREDLNAIDRASAYREYCTRFRATPDVLSEKLGEDRTTITNYLRILELPEAVKKLVASKQLSMGHARCLLGVDEAADREALAQRILLEQLSVRAAESLVRGHKLAGRAADRLKRTSAGEAGKPQVLAVQSQLERVLGTKVTIIESAKKGQGRVIIEYQSLDDFDRLCQKLGVALE
ncbi:MAG: ParB/RepB/Spo0J family partition protein [Phycisphaerales bacterium]|nr:ParB/RepB/Spo0J family partition protein [Phycisphaerales bacterium]